MTFRLGSACGWFLVAGLSAACTPSGGGDSEPTPTPRTAVEPLAQLRPVDDCESLKGALQRRAIEEMEELLILGRQRAKAACVDLSVGPPLGNAGGGEPAEPSQDEPPEDGVEEPDPGDGDGGEDPDERGDFGAPTGAEGVDDGKRPEHSDTNTQVDGVDEADLVETDGDHLYLIDDDKLRILRIWPPEEAGPLAEIELHGARRMYVDGDRAMVFSDVTERPLYSEASVTGAFGPGGIPDRQDGLCRYGLDCDLSGGNNPLRVTAIDLTDRSAPVVVRETEFNGAYLDSRRIGDAVHTVVEFKPAYLEGLRYYPERAVTCDDPESLDAAFEALRAANLERIQQADLEDWLPSLTDLRLDGEAPQAGRGLLAECDNVYFNLMDSGRGFLSVVSNRMDGTASWSAHTIVGRPGAVYSSADTLYVASRHRRDQEAEWYPGLMGDEATSVHRFDLREEQRGLDAQGRPVVRYVGSAVVKGLVLGQFALDDRAGTLRLATSNNYFPAARIALDAPEQPGARITTQARWTVPDSAFGTMTTLEPEFAGLKVQGQSDAIAGGAAITAVRYRGAVAYVSQEGAEALQVVDFTDPAAPVARGQVHVDGTLRYLHPVEGDRVIAVGEANADAEVGGLTINVLDVSDLDAPALINGVSLQGGRSLAVNDHLAFTFYRPHAALTIPLTHCDAQGRVDFDGLVMYRLGADGLTEQGRVSHIESTGELSEFCGDTRNTVVRSVFVDDYVVSISDAAVLIHGVDGLDLVNRVSIDDEDAGAEGMEPGSGAEVPDEEAPSEGDRDMP